ncbi:MAG: TolC family protein [Rectinemataceae bacterium]
MKKNGFLGATLCLLGAALVAQQAGAAGAASPEQSPAPSAPAAMPGSTAPMSASSSAVSPALKVITLQEAIDAAVANGPDMKIVRGTLDVAGAQYALAATKGTFTLSTTGGYSAIDGLGSTYESSAFAPYSSTLETLLGTTSTNVSNTANAGIALTGPLTQLGLNVGQIIPPSDAALNAQITTAQLSLTQTIWDGYPGGQIKASIDKSLLAFQGQELASVQGRITALFNVKQAYVTMLTDQRNLAVKRQILDSQNSLLAQIRAVYDLKQASTVDLMTAQVNARGADLDVAQADHDLRLARQRLAILLGYPPDSRFAVAETADPPMPAPSLEQAIAVGLQKRPDLAQLGLSRRSSGIDLLLAAGSAQPTVSVTGGLDAAVAWPGSSIIDAASVSAGVKIAMPVADAGAARDQEEAASRQIDLYDVQRSQLAFGIAADIRDAYESALILRDRVDLAQKNMEALDALFVVTKTQNQYGTATTQDVLTASVNAATAEVAYQTSRNAYLLGVFTLETDMGL